MNDAITDVAEQLVIPGTGNLYSIKRHGTSLTTCESEPVHTPGCIQSHGVMLVVRLIDFTIIQVSENCEAHIGKAPSFLLGHPLTDLIGANNQVKLVKMIASDPIERNVQFAFTLASNRALPALDICIHTINGMLILEGEPSGTLPGGSDASSEDYFILLKSAVSRLQNVTNSQQFCECVATEVHNMTRLDRVMIYRFHADQHGEVIAESKNACVASFLGLHYPEADIPQQARALYKCLWVRPVPDISGVLAEITPLANPDSGLPLDMTYCVLRGVSVMYSEYLANMGVAASLTMPLRVDGELWGMIACHHNTPTYFGHQLRSACELLARVASLQLKSVQHFERLAYQMKIEDAHRKLVASAAKENDLLAISDNQPALLNVMDAGGAALRHLNRWRCAGHTPNEAQLNALADWLFEREEFQSLSSPIYATDMLSRDYAAGVEIINVACGVIAVQIARARGDLIIWFRPETIQSVHWAGDPQDKPLVPGPHGLRLTPRRSFDRYIESVRARAIPWTQIDLDAALRLRTLIMELVIVAIERLAKLNAELTDSNKDLDAFAFVASNDLKEPLRGIHRYAHQMMESAEIKSSDNRQRLDNLMRLALRMDSLLDSLLNYSRIGRTNLAVAPIDLNQVVTEAIEMVGIRSEDNNCVITIDRPLPTIEGAFVRVREIFSNLISNAQKYNRHAQPHIDIGYLLPEEANRCPSAPLEAKGQTIFFVRDDGIGIAPRHFAQIFRMFKRLHARDDFGGGVGAGLSVVKKVISRHGGSLWVDSALDIGSTFYFTLSGKIEASG